MAARGAGRSRRARRTRHLDGLLERAADRPSTSHGDDGAWHAPFIYRWRLVNRLEQRYEEDRSARVALSWFTGGHLVQSSDDAAAPLLLLGADSFGRDVFARLVYGARMSLGAGARRRARRDARSARAIGGLAGYAGGAVDEAADARDRFRDGAAGDLRRAGAARRAAAGAQRRRRCSRCSRRFSPIVGAPFVARGVRAIVRSERRLDYAAAAQALGASHARVLLPSSAAGGARLHRRRRSRCSCRRSSSPKRRCRTSVSGFPIRSPAGARCCTTRREHPRVRRLSVAAESGGGDVPRRPRREPRAAGEVRRRSAVPAGADGKIRRMNLAGVFAPIPTPVRRSRPRRHRAAQGGARQVGDDAADRLRRARIERRSGADGRLRVAIRRSSRRATRCRARRRVHRRHRPRVDAGDDQGDASAPPNMAPTPCWCARRDSSRAQMTNDVVRPSLHRGGRRVAGAGAALQLHRGHRREPAAGGGRAAGDASEHRRHEGIGRRRRAGRRPRVADARRLHACSPARRRRFYPALCVGAAGGILALACALPEPCVRLFELTQRRPPRRGDRAAAASWCRWRGCSARSTACRD